VLLLSRTAKREALILEGSIAVWPHLQVSHCRAVVGQHPASIIDQPHVTQHVGAPLARLQQGDSRQIMNDLSH
jgi:hypothetical protein